MTIPVYFRAVRIGEAEVKGGGIVEIRVNDPECWDFIRNGTTTEISIGFTGKDARFTGKDAVEITLGGTSRVP